MARRSGPAASASPTPRPEATEPLAPVTARLTPNEVEIARRFARNLVENRERAGLSQVEVAARAALYLSRVEQLEAGKRLPLIDVTIKLAGALGVEPAELLRGCRWRPPEVERHGAFRC